MQSWACGSACAGLRLKMAAAATPMPAKKRPMAERRDTPLARSFASSSNCLLKVLLTFYIRNETENSGLTHSYI